jgi:hypothetical protein
MFEVIFDRNGAKVYVKNLRVLSHKKSAKRGFLKSPSQYSKTNGSVRTCVSGARFFISNKLHRKLSKVDISESLSYLPAFMCEILVKLWG